MKKITQTNPVFNLKWELRILLMFCLLLTYIQISFAQTANQYSYTVATGAVLEDMSGSTQLLGASTDDTPSALTNIGFSFGYVGNNYTEFSVTPDGFLKLGAPVTGSQFTNSITSTSNIPKLFPLWDDFATGSAAGGGQVHYKLTGSAPNQKLIVEWFITVPRNTTGPANARFQVWLNETTDVIDFVYGPNTGNPSSASVGINGPLATNYISVTPPANTFSSSTANNSVNTYPGDGTIYTFTPPQPCNSTPTAGNISAPSSTCSGIDFTLTLMGTSTDLGLTYQWQKDDGSGFVNFGTNSSTATDNITGSTTYQVIVTCTNSGLTATTAPVTVNITQCIIMSNGSATICDGLFYDSGGPDNNSCGVSLVAGNYLNNENYIFTINPTAGNLVQVDFNYFCTESGFDFLRIYNGTSTSDPLIGQFSGTANPGIITSTTGPLTFHFTSDGSVTRRGWEAMISCIPAPPCETPIASAATSVTHNSAQANWSCVGCSGTFILEYGEASTFTTPGTDNTAGAGGTVVLNATSPHLLSGLNPTTQYRYFVRQNCGGIFSSNSNGILFTTPVTPPANDLCEDAIPITCGGSISSTTVGANPDANTCGGVNSPGVWYSITPPTSQLITLSLCTGTTYDSRLSAYTGSCGALSMIACNDDFCGLQSQISFVGTGGVTYYILVNAFSTSSGPFTLTATCAPLPAPTCPTSHTPANNAVNVLPNQQLSWSGSQFATSYNVYFGTTNPPAFAGNTASPTFNPGTLSNNTVYYWRVEPINDVDTIDNCITNQFTTAPPPPANDLCADAFLINCGDVVSGQTASATNIGNGPTCVTAGSTAGGVWYKFIGDGKIVTASLCGSSYDTKIFIYTGTCGNFTCVTGNDDFCGLQSQVTFTSSVGIEYYILVAGFSSATGNFTLSLTCECPYTASISQSLTGTCNLVNLTANASLAGNYTYLWSTSETTQTIQVQVTSTQNYSVTIFDANNCDETASTTVEFNNGPTLNVTPAQQLFCGEANAQLDAGTSGALIFSNNTSITVPSSGTASPYPSNINVSGLSLGATVESVTLNSINHTFPSDLDIALVSPSGEVVVLMSDIGGGTDLTGETYIFIDGFPILGSGFNSTGTYSPTNSGATDTWTAPGPGSITQASPALSMFTGNPNGSWQLFVVDDAGGDLGSIGGWSIEFADASALTYSWTPTTGLSDPIIPNPIATPTTSTLYIVVVTDPSSGCTSSGSSNILVDPVPTPVISPSSNIHLCSGESEVVSTQYLAGDGYSFDWGLITTETFNVSVADNYTMHVTSPNGCISDPVSFTVNITEVVPDFSNVTDALCFGDNTGSVELVPLGAITEPGFNLYFGPFDYSMNGGPLQSSPLFTGLAAGTYNFEIHDPVSGCFASVVETVGEPDPLVGSTTVLSGTTCFGGSDGSASASATGGTGPYTFDWLTPVPKSGENNDELPGGTWTVVVTDANGCTSTTTVTIPEPNPVIVNLGDDRVVPYGTAGSFNYSGCTDIIPVITGAVLPYQSISWSTGATTQNINVCNPTPGIDAIVTYTVTVIDANGCTGVGSVTLIFAGIDCSNNSNGTKVKICNVPPGNPSNCNTICVSVNAASALLANGSYVGQCNPGCAPARIMSPDPVASEISVHIMPNPTSGKLIVDFMSNDQQATSISMMDLQGRIVLNVSLDGSPSFTQEVHLGNLENGLYILNVMNKDGVISTSRVVKAE